MQPSPIIPFEHDETEQLEGGRVRGWILRAHLLWVRSYGTDEELRDLWQDVDPAAARGLRAGFDYDGWFPFAWLIGLDRAIYRNFGQGVALPAVLEDLGRFSARVNLSSRFEQWSHSDHHRFFAETTTIHHEFQDFGTAEYHLLDERAGQMVHRNNPCSSRIYCASAIGYYEQCLILHGAIRPVVTEQTCQCLGWDACRFELRWR